MATALWKRPGVLLAAASVYAGSTAFAYLTFYEPKADASLADVTDERRVQVFNDNATKYDKDVDVDELLTGIALLRRFLLRKATGDVLEVAAGTGRNLSYYTPHTRVTLTDVSDAMLQQVPAKATALGRGSPAYKLQVMSATALTFDDETFDTVVDTFGLCSMDDSVAALAEMQRVCKRDGSGRILLLEHGRSHYAWLSRLLDKFAPQHAQRWGCHWNRDILALVEAAGLDVVTVHRFHFGTTYWIEAKPRAASSVELSTENALDK